MTVSSRTSIKPVAIIAASAIVWLMGLAAMGILQLYYVYAYPLAILWGVTCYLVGFLIVKDARTRNLGVWRTAALHVVAAALIIGAPLYVVQYFSELTWNPIGVSSDLGPGAPACHVFPDRITANASGRVIVTRRNWCDFGFGASASSYFLFVRRADEESNRHNLVFRYDTTLAGWGNDPRVRWRSPSVVEIFVAGGAIKSITKMKRFQDDVYIVYHITKSSAHD